MKMRKGDRKSRTPVMPRDGMRIEKPGRGPWCENEEKKKKKDEWRREKVPDSCYATRWHVDRGAKKKKKKPERESESRTPVILLSCYIVRGRGIKGHGKRVVDLCHAMEQWCVPGRGPWEERVANS